MLIVITHLHFCFYIGFAGIHGKHHEEILGCFSLFPCAVIGDTVYNNGGFGTPDVEAIFIIDLLRSHSQMCQQEQADGQGSKHDVKI